MIQKMKGKISAGLLRFRSAGHAAGRAPAATEPDEVQREDSWGWAQLPPELLRMVLARVEGEEARWPGRSAVVASAGVCRCWRAMVKDITMPQDSGKLTFPVSLKEPGPRDAPMKCFIKRDRSTQSYSLYIGLTDELYDDGKFLLAARRNHRPAGTEYLIYLTLKNTSKGAFIGTIRSNFLGTKFTVYDAHPTCSEAVVSKGPSAHSSHQDSPGVPAGKFPVSRIYYEAASFNSRLPRKMNCVMDSIPVSVIQGGTAPMQTGIPSVSSCEAKMVLKNKSPRWLQNHWGLHFHGRVTIPSVKNFQLVASSDSEPNNQDDDDVILQFGKIGDELFTMDYRYPISAFQAFAICLSSFETKIGCE